MKILLLLILISLSIKFIVKKDYINNFITRLISLEKIEILLKILQVIYILSFIFVVVYFFNMTEEMNFILFISYIVGLFTLSCGILLINYILRTRP
jgi:LPS O-antigen subunit length determinant protein (WzzB/FepE family)